MRKVVFITAASSLLLIISLCALVAQEKSSAPSSIGRISLPWEKFLYYTVHYLRARKKKRQAASKEGASGFDI
jgi:hypothetical protein